MAKRPAVPDPSQFSLFDEPSAAGDASAGSPLSSPACEPEPSISTPSGIGGLADGLPFGPSTPQTSAPAVPLASVLSPASFSHPQANREIRLDEHRVGYALKRVRRKTIGFIVGAEGLSVNAPKWVSVGDIESALREKGTWILRKLREQRERQQRQQEARIEWKDGTSIPFLGETVILVLDPRATGAILNTDADSLPGVPRLTLHVGLSQAATADQIRDTVQSWLQRQARRVFEERCRHFAEQLGVRYTRLSLSSAQTRWGSASADGSIRLNWRLIHFPMSTIDYVVAHELAHLRHMDHSPRFWDVVRSVVPDYERLRGQLREDVLPVLE
jgi:predicted metal-dependent hydrolase